MVRGEGRIFLVGLQYLVGSLVGQDDRSEVYEHCDAHGVNEKELVCVSGERRFVSFEEDRVPDGEGRLQSELACVQASDPSQQEGLGLDILEFEDAEEL